MKNYTERCFLSESDLEERIEKAQGNFKEMFFSDPVLTVRSPGRAEIIGNHTDYNEGYALAACISKSILAVSNKRKNNVINIYTTHAGGKKETFKISPGIPKSTTDTWSNYARGVAEKLWVEGYKIGGADIYIDSNLPATGVSSSAAFELAMAHTLLGLYKETFKKLDIANICQYAENEYVGSPCGFLDQGSIVYGEYGKMILFDFMKIDDNQVSKIDLVKADLSLADVSFVIIADKNVKRELGSSGYPARRKMCEDSLIFWEEKFGVPVRSLRFVTMKDFERYKDELDTINSTMRKRVEHVLCENRRVLEFMELLKINRIKEAGELLTLSGESALNLYDLDEQTPELTYLCKTGANFDGVLGYRNMGGGFNATTLALVANSCYIDFHDKLSTMYSKKFSGQLEFIRFRITDGVGYIVK